MGGLGRAVSAWSSARASSGGFQGRVDWAIEVCDGRNVVSFCGPRGAAQRDRGKSRCAMTGVRWASRLLLATTSFEKVTNGHGFVAVGAGTAQAGSPHKRPAVGVVLVAYGPFAATVALVGGDRPLGALARHRDFGGSWGGAGGEPAPGTCRPITASRLVVALSLPLLLRDGLVLILRHLPWGHLAAGRTLVSPSACTIRLRSRARRRHFGGGRRPTGRASGPPSAPATR